MIDWKAKLTSRKLWVAVTEFVSMLMVAFGYAEDTVTQIAALIMAGAGLVAYIVAEGLVDAKAAQAAPPLILNAVDEKDVTEIKNEGAE